MFYNVAEDSCPIVNEASVVRQSGFGLEFFLSHEMIVDLKGIYHVLTQASLTQQAAVLWLEGLEFCLALCVLELDPDVRSRGRQACLFSSGWVGLGSKHG